MLAVACVAVSSIAAAPPNVGVDEHPGARLPLDVPLRDARNTPVRLRDLVGSSQPTVLVLAYYSCPMLCDRLLAGLVPTLTQARQTAGSDYRALAVSFDPRDTPADALALRDRLLDGLNPFERAHWRFATGSGQSTRAIADAVGFQYWKDERSGQYAHPAVVIVLTPDGRVSQYLYGVGFGAGRLATALGDAAAGRSVSAVERVLLTCFQYVPALRQHATAVRWLLRGGGLAAFAALGLSLVWLVRRQREKGTGA